MSRDVVLIHPPAIHDFRKKTVFPGPIAYTVTESTEQFTIPPIGMLSLAEYLDRHGFKTIVDNLGERMVYNESLDVERHLRRLSAKVYAVGLHWSVHSQGAIEIAKLCKRLHPDALVALGGLTATVFHKEIIQKLGFIDVVVRGEAEKAFLRLVETLENNKKLKTVGNLTFRAKDKTVVTPLVKPVANLDEFEFTRLDLMEPKNSIFSIPSMPPHWSIPICRGCAFNCVSCGGSAYSYRTYLGREKPAFRSPEKIADDLQKLREQGVRAVFLFQDPRMGGKTYWRKLVKTLRGENIQLTQLSMELFNPAREEYIRALSTIDVPVALSISPESGVESVRMAHGRNYTNEELFATLRTSKKHGIPLGVFFMTALAQDTDDTIRETWSVWEKICRIDKAAEGRAPVHHAFGPMVLLDPGSLAFDLPANYGYRVISKTLEDYIKGMSFPSWHMWISYETKFLSKELIANNILDSIEYSIHLRERYGVYDRSKAAIDRLHYVSANRLVIKAVNKSMNLQDENERLDELKSLRKFLTKKLKGLSADST